MSGPIITNGLNKKVWCLVLHDTASNDSLPLPLGEDMASFLQSRSRGCSSLSFSEIMETPDASNRLGKLIGLDGNFTFERDPIIRGTVGYAVLPDRLTNRFPESVSSDIVTIFNIQAYQRIQYCMKSSMRSDHDISRFDPLTIEAFRQGVKCPWFLNSILSLAKRNLSNSDDAGSILMCGMNINRTNSGIWVTLDYGFSASHRLRPAS